MKFKCLLSGCVYNFESILDIKSMQSNLDYELVQDAPVLPTTPIPVKPVAVAPAKPIPVPPVASKAV